MSLINVTSVRLNSNDLESLKVIDQKHGEHVHLSQSDLIRIAINKYADMIRAEVAKESSKENKSEN